MLVEPGSKYCREDWNDSHQQPDGKLHPAASDRYKIVSEITIVEQYAPCEMGRLRPCNRIFSTAQASIVTPHRL